MSLCRICLSEAVEKDITQLEEEFKGEEFKNSKSYSDIMLFCLGIKVSPKSKVSTKLCIKCFENIISFYKFKNLAIENHAHLQLLQGEENDKCESSKIDNSQSKVIINGTENELNDARNMDESAKKVENKNKVKEEQPQYELLSGMQNVQYTYVSQAEEEDDWQDDCAGHHQAQAEPGDNNFTANAPPLFVRGGLDPPEPNAEGHSRFLGQGNPLSCYRVRNLRSNGQSLNDKVRSFCVLLHVNNTRNT